MDYIHVWVLILFLMSGVCYRRICLFLVIKKRVVLLLYCNIRLCVCAVRVRLLFFDDVVAFVVDDS